VGVVVGHVVVLLDVPSQLGLLGLTVTELLAFFDRGAGGDAHRFQRFQILHQRQLSVPIRVLEPERLLLRLFSVGIHHALLQHVTREVLVQAHVHHAATLRRGLLDVDREFGGHFRYVIVCDL